MSSELALEVALCWSDAEKQLKTILADRYWDADEEFITTLLRGELRLAFRKRSGSSAFSDALIRDLRPQFPSASDQSLQSAAAGLPAVVTFHPRHVEAMTGGDLGIVVYSPRFEQEGNLARQGDDSRHGLLVQAKLFGRNGAWGSLTTNQRTVLSGRESYLAILLYKYADGNQRRNLNAFDWQMCNGHSVADIEHWLATANFPDVCDSSKVVRGLADGSFGTSDAARLRQWIAPESARDTLVVHLQFSDPNGHTFQIEHQTVHVETLG